jgi:hypothetical protein
MSQRPTRKPLLQAILALVLFGNAAVFAMPAFVGQSLKGWEIGVVVILAALGVAFGIAGLKGLRSAG